MKDIVLLDSDSNATIFCNLKFINKIWDIEQRVKVDSNGDGRLACTKQ